MGALFLSRITVVWALLLAATLASWEMGHGRGVIALAEAAVGIILVSLVKIYLVMAEFMELRHAPRLARLCMGAWLVGLGAVLVTSYLTAGG